MLLVSQFFPFLKGLIGEFCLEADQATRVAFREAIFGASESTALANIEQLCGRLGGNKISVQLVVKATRAFVHQNYRFIVDATSASTSASTPASTPETAAVQPLCFDSNVLESPWFAVSFLRLLSETRFMKHQERLTLFARWEQMLQSKNLVEHLDLLRIERLSFEMGLGNFKKVAEELASAFPKKPSWHFANFADFRRSVVFGICHQAMGNYHLAQVELTYQHKIASATCSLYLQLGVLRREVSLLIEAENYERATKTIDSLLPKARALGEPGILALCLDERIRLACALNQKQIFQQSFALLSELKEQRLIANSFLAGVESRCESSYWEGNSDVASRFILDELWQVTCAENLGGQALAQLLLARALLKEGALKTAELNAQTSVSLSTRLGLGRHLVRSLSLQTAVQFHMGNKEEAGQNLARAQRLALQMRLSSHSLALWVLWFLHGNSICEPPKVKLIGETWESAGKLLIEWNIVTNLLPRLLMREILYHADKNLLVTINSQTSELQTTILSTAKAKHQIFVFLLQQKEVGAGVELLHSIFWQKVRFVAAKHSKEVHGNLRAARKFANLYALEIVLKGAVYVLQGKEGKLVHLYSNDAIRKSQSPFLQTNFRLRKTDQIKHSGKTERRRKVENYILASLESGPKSGAQLAQELNMARQSLQPVLQELREEGKVLHLKKGRYSTYRI